MLVVAPRRRAAIATTEEFADLDEGWPILRHALASVAVAPEVVFWDDPDVPWGEYDVVVSMFAWGYVTRRPQFVSWTEKVAASTVIVNPAPVLCWNSDKTYLADLAAAGIPIVPTQWIGPGSSWHPPSGDYVIKPTVGSGGIGAARYVTGAVDVAERHVRRLHDEGYTAMVQPYQPTVDANGETALIFVDGRFSHAVNKGALLQADVGVTDRLWEHQVITPAQPRDDQRALAETVVRTVERRFGSTGYGRVDLVDATDGLPLVLELELVEPALFLTHAPGAADHLAAYLRNLT